MTVKNNLSRRQFVGGVAAAIGYAGLGPSVDVFAQNAHGAGQAAKAKMPLSQAVAEYDAAAKLANNENPFGPPESVIKAMTSALKYANRYGYPDGGIIDAIAEHHGVKPENVILGTGSSEILTMTDTTFLQGGKKVIGVEPTYATVYQYATNSKSDAIKLPLLKDYRQDMPAMIHTVKANYRDVGFVYLCNPNNPTAMIIPKQEVKQLLDSIPEDVPVLMDEAYHHFVDDPNYETSIPYVKEGRQVIVARTFSKIVGLAGMRLGYAVAPKSVIDRMRPFAMSYGINAIVKWGGAAALHAIRRRRTRSGRSHIGCARRPPADLAGASATKRMPTADQLLHGPHRPRRRAGDRGVQEEHRARRPPVPADDAAPARLDRHGGRNGALHDRVQGNLPGEG